MNSCFMSVWCEMSDGWFVWGSSHSVEGESKYKRRNVGSKGMTCLSVVLALEGYSEVIGVKVDSGMWN